MHELVYDSTFEGLLTAVFEVYERRLDQVTLVRGEQQTEQLFAEKVHVISNEVQAARVWNGLKKKLTTQQSKKIFSAFLTEDQATDQHILQYIRYIFDSGKNVSGDYGHPSVLKVSQAAKMAGREAHRMEAFVRFELTQDGIYFSTIEPDFDVIPLITNHFKNRYADQKWLIYDFRRKYGIYYDLNGVDEIKFTSGTSDELQGGPSRNISFSHDEELFKKLWQDYFHHTNIKARRNLKLHLQHVPRRYWKYMSEKHRELN